MVHIRAIERTQQAGHSQWRSHAACREKDISWFIPERTNDPDIYRAKKICNSCEVRSDCLEWALETHVDSPTGRPEGIYGGTTDKERLLIRALMGGQRYEDVKRGATSSETSSHTHDRTQLAG